MELKSKKIAEAGFSHIHWCFEWTVEYIYSKADMGDESGCGDAHRLPGVGRHVARMRHMPHHLELPIKRQPSV